ncbi:uncharacterized protein [Elaeis guineensis]|uniref:uncharacterized protein isoform X2 n=1 Tax=Elaeis guineensis var. tenera TaxID=51953 RepID=UPI003C6CFA88
MGRWQWLIGLIFISLFAVSGGRGIHIRSYRTFYMDVLKVQRLDEEYIDHSDPHNMHIVSHQLVSNGNWKYSQSATLSYLSSTSYHWSSGLLFLD